MTTEKTTPRYLDQWYFEDLAPNGFRAGRPPWLTAEAERIDRDAAEGYPCERCGGACRYWPTFNPTTRVYRAFTRCDECGDVAEF